MKTFWIKHRTNITFTLIGVIIFSLFILSFLWPMKEDKPVEEKQEEIKEEIETVQVDIKGEIVTPGVYEMSKSQRVIDVIKKAGNLTKSADTSMINLSQKLKDEMVIIIYSKEEVEKMNKEEPCICPENNDACINDDDKAVIKESDKTETKTPNSSDKLSINKATKDQLMTLDGIGEAKAKAIIEYRNKNGLFKKIEDLKEVSGIGDSVYEKIKDHITT